MHWKNLLFQVLPDLLVCDCAITVSQLQGVFNVNVLVPSPDLKMEWK